MLRNRRLDARVLEHRLGVEGREEAAHDEVVDAQVVGVHLVDRVLGAGGDDRVVVGDLGVVDHATQRQQVEPGHIGGGVAIFRAGADEFRRRLDLARHVAGQEARVRAWVGQRLVLLVEALSRAERTARREPEARVCVALERGEVVKHRRLLGDLALLDLGDLAGAVAHRRHDRERLGLGCEAWLGAGVEAAVVAAGGIH